MAIHDNIGRRSFLKLAALTAGTIAEGLASKKFSKYGLGRQEKNLKKSPKSDAEKPTNTEVEKQSPSVAVLDFFNLESRREMFIKNYFPKGFSVQNALDEMGVIDSSSKEGMLHANPKNEDQARLFMLIFLELHYASHGKDVASILGKTASLLDSGSTGESVSYINSIAEAVILEKIEFDKIGNPTMHQIMDKDAIKTMLSWTTENIINMSFEPGKSSLTFVFNKEKVKYPEMGRMIPNERKVGDETSYTDYQGNIISKDEYLKLMKKVEETELVVLDSSERSISFQDGYASKDTLQNVVDLVDIAHTYPDKFFIAAGGNPFYFNGLKYPDIREARREITERGFWPENLIIVGFEANEAGQKLPASLGADIYVSSEDLRSFGFPGASSYATPVITEVIRQIEEVCGVDENAKQLLFEKMTVDKEIQFGQNSVEYKLLDLLAVESYVKEKLKEKSSK